MIHFQAQGVMINLQAQVYKIIGSAQGYKIIGSNILQSMLKSKLQIRENVNKRIGMCENPSRKGKEKGDDGH